MKTLKLVNGDLCYENDSFVLIDGKDAVRQRLINAIKLDKGSWFFDPDKGIPWFEIYNKKAVSERLIRSNIEKILKADSEVESVDSLVVSFDRATRMISVTFEVTTIYGKTGGSV